MDLFFLKTIDQVLVKGQNDQGIFSSDLVLECTIAILIGRQRLYLNRMLHTNSSGHTMSISFSTGNLRRS